MCHLHFVQVLHLGTTLRFEFYEGAKQEGSVVVAPGRQRTIQIAGLDKFLENEMSILEQLVKRFNVPQALRYG
jgi:hypothetical protein